MCNANLIAGLIATLIVSTLPCGLFAQAGLLDPDFDADGMVTTAIGASGDGAGSVAIQPDGKIVVAGFTYNDTDFDFALVRYHADGTLDNSFSADGKVTTAIGAGDDWARSVAIQPDGKIVAAGYSDNGPNVDFAVVRYNADGTLDTSFSADGMVTTAIGTSTDMATSVAIQPDEKIVVAGYTYNGTDFDFAVVRYHADGTLDGSFSADGKVTTALGASDQAFSVALQPDGRIVVVGYSGDVQNDDFAVVRYNADGTLDTTFSADGKVTTAIGTSNDVASSVAIQPDGRIVAAGSTGNGPNADVAVVRYNADGSLDTSFSADGMVTTDIGTHSDVANSVAIQPDGKIVAAGSSSTGTNIDFAVVRYLSGLNAGVIDLSGPGAAALIYPNPLDNDATLHYVLGNEERISIHLLDLEGSVVHTFVENRLQGAGEHQEAIALPELASGSYFIVISSADGKVSIRIVK